MSIIYLMIIEGGHQLIPINISRQTNLINLFLYHILRVRVRQTFSILFAVAAAVVVAILQPNPI